MKKVLAMALLLVLGPTLVVHARGIESGPLSLHVVKVKGNNSWTEVQIAVENRRDQDLNMKCCTAFLENQDGYSIASLNSDDIRAQNYNKARTPALIGGVIAAGLGIGGAMSNNKGLQYAALGTGAASAIGAIAGDSAANKRTRNLLIDDVMRNQLFPGGLKVAGVVYFPPQKKWPGSRKAQAVHISYNYGGRTYRASAKIN